MSSIQKVINISPSCEVIFSLVGIVPLLSRDQGTTWRENEFGDLGLTKLLSQIAQKLANNPQASIPRAWETVGNA